MGMFSDILERNQELAGQMEDQQRRNKLEQAMDKAELRQRELAEQELNMRLAAAHRYTA